jgi:hypothetical protein
MEMSGKLHAPAALPLENLSNIYWKRGWVSPRAGLESSKKRNISCLVQESNLDLPAVQPLASRYTDWAIPAPKHQAKLLHSNFQFDVSLLYLYI